MNHTCYIALGGNLGHPQQTFLMAIAALTARPGVDLLAHSSLYRTSAVGGPAGQDPYLNAVVSLSTTWTPHALLAELQRIEMACGRQRTARWGPRTLDLDVLLFGQAVLNAPHLQVPHPRLHERLFVLEPLCEIAADLHHPVLGDRIATLRATASAASGERIEKLASPGWLTPSSPPLMPAWAAVEKQ